MNQPQQNKAQSQHQLNDGSVQLKVKKELKVLQKTCNNHIQEILDKIEMSSQQQGRRGHDHDEDAKPEEHHDGSGSAGGGNDGSGGGNVGATGSATGFNKILQLERTIQQLREEGSQKDRTIQELKLRIAELEVRYKEPQPGTNLFPLPKHQQN